MNPRVLAGGRWRAEAEKVWPQEQAAEDRAPSLRGRRLQRPGKVGSGFSWEPPEEGGPADRFGTSGNRKKTVWLSAPGPRLVTAVAGHQAAPGNTSGTPGMDAHKHQRGPAALVQRPKQNSPDLSMSDNGTQRRPCSTEHMHARPSQDTVPSGETVPRTGTGGF